jgi:hypothetical protein
LGVLIMVKRRITAVERQDCLRELGRLLHDKAIAEIRRSRKADSEQFANGYMHGWLAARDALLAFAKLHNLEPIDLGLQRLPQELSDS